MHSLRPVSVFSFSMLRKSALLAMSCFSAHGWAQAAPSPTPGQWEVRSEVSGAPRGNENATRSACLTAAAFAEGIESAFRKVASENSKGRQPECKYDMTSQQSGKNAWSTSCKVGPMSIAGTGQSTWDMASFSSSEKLSGQTPMGDLNIQRAITAKRLGDCAK